MKYFLISLLLVYACKQPKPDLEKQIRVRIEKNMSSLNNSLDSAGLERSALKVDSLHILKIDTVNENLIKATYFVRTSDSISGWTKADTVTMDFDKNLKLIEPE